MNEISLTDFLSATETLQLINANFRNPIKNNGARLVVEPAKDMGVDFVAVGTAFDYWLRCELKQSDPDICTTFLGYQFCVRNYGDTPKVLKILKRHTKTMSDFSKGTLDSKEKLFEACLFIAKFETEYRCGYPVETFEVNRQNVEELSRIANATNFSLLQNKQLFLNPVLDIQGSKLAILADADIVLGECLVDLKTSSTISLKNNLRQLIGYWVLNKLRGASVEINRLGVYYPRFNYFVDFSPSDLMTPDEQINITSFFQQKLGKGIKARERIV